MHNRYKQMCALAATGQLELDERERLEKHLAFCDSCREMAKDLSILRLHAVPMISAQRLADPPIEPPAGMRERFLERLGSSGLAVQDPVPPAGPEIVRHPVIARDRAAGWSAVQTWLSPRRMALSTALMVGTACLLFGLVGYIVARQHYLNAAGMSANEQIPSRPPLSQKTSHPAAAEVVLSVRQDLEHQVQAISTQLSAAEAEKRNLANQLASLTDDASRRDSQFEQQLLKAERSLQDSEDQAATLRAKLDAFQHKLDEANAVLVAQQQAAEDATAKLTETEFQLQSERQEKEARSEAAQLISARNLHIVDVHDSEPGGKEQRAFGRVFYVEGRSLVFYAYDLAAAKHSNQHFVFHVWGETAGVKDTSYRLGILKSDDSSQARWVLTFDDPKVLNRINAVYITADHDARPKGTPSGKKFLYAFLGTSNHP